MSDDGRGDLVYGGVEAGGTKFVCAVASDPEHVEAIVEIPTRDPVSSIREAAEFFRSRHPDDRPLAALGVGSFGPLELDPQAPTYGQIASTPKAGWEGVDIRGEFARALDVPVAIETDVNAAALGEQRWGNGRGLAHFLYVTVGTGIGVGAVVADRLLRGAHHPEMGHVSVPRSRDEPNAFSGCCPYHQACIEGLASGTAIVERWGSRLGDLPLDHPAWGLEAGYLGTFLSDLTFTLQPERIIVGGGVMSEQLLSDVRGRLHKALAGYRQTLASSDVTKEYLVMPELGDRAGVLGAIALAKTHRGLRPT